jgi:hypothetical protein
LSDPTEAEVGLVAASQEAKYAQEVVVEEA